MVLVAVAVAYALGTLPTAIVVGGRRGHDPTAEGSGNPGATNVYRTAGRRAGAAVLVGDLAKGSLAAGLGLLVGDATVGLAVGAAAVVGHVAPVQRRFRGGKGVATAAGVALVVHPLVTLGLAAVFAIVARVTRMASVASITICVLWPIAAALTGRPGAQVTLAAGIGVLVVLRHRANIARLLSRSESRLGP